MGPTISPGGRLARAPPGHSGPALGGIPTSHAADRRESTRAVDTLKKIAPAHMAQGSALYTASRPRETSGRKSCTARCSRSISAWARTCSSVTAVLGHGEDPAIAGDQHRAEGRFRARGPARDGEDFAHVCFVDREIGRQRAQSSGWSRKRQLCREAAIVHLERGLYDVRDISGRNLVGLL